MPALCILAYPTRVDEKVRSVAETAVLTSLANTGQKSLGSYVGLLVFLKASPQNSP